MGPRKLPDSASAVVDHPPCRHTNEVKDRAKPRVQLVSILREIDRQGLPGDRSVEQATVGERSVYLPYEWILTGV